MKRKKRVICILFSLILLFSYAGSSAYAETLSFGDVDGDGAVRSEDAGCVTRFLSDMQRLDVLARTRADVNGDGRITDVDASLIMSAASQAYAPAGERHASMLITSDMKGMAWSAPRADGEPGYSALNVFSYIAKAKEADPGLLLLDAGGSLFGSAISDAYVTHTTKFTGPMTALFLQAGYSAVLLGDEALTYSSSTVRNEMNALTESGVKVLGANLIKNRPGDPGASRTAWNGILPYTILEAPQTDGEPVRVGVIGFVEPDLAVGDDEIAAFDPRLCYDAIKTELYGACDVVVLLYHGTAESDESRSDAYSLRDFLRQTSGIDLVFVSHGAGDGVRCERNVVGREVPMVLLPEGTESVTECDIAVRDLGAPAFSVRTVDVRTASPIEEQTRLIEPYASAVSDLLDATVCTLQEPIDAFAPDSLVPTDGMELIHQMQEWCVRQWIDENGLDLPSDVLSIAYPYLGTQGFASGELRYGELCKGVAELPRYTLLLGRGKELKAWLTASAETITGDSVVYSLHGLSYLINTINPEHPLGYLEYASGAEVEDDALFTVLLAEAPDGEPILKPFLDEAWMSYQDRVISDFELPAPQQIETTATYHAFDALVAFLESNETLTLSSETTWIVI